MRFPWEPVTEAVKGVVDIGKEYIVDKDKQIEFEYKISKSLTDQINLILSTVTVPWVDAVVKVLFALKTLARPLMGGAMTVFAMYCVVNGIEMPKELLVVFSGGFPAWGLSRYLEKVRGKD